MKHHPFYLYFLSSFLFLGITTLHAQDSKLKKGKKQFVNGISKVAKIPLVYEYPTSPAMRNSGKVMEKPWIVYSDRSNNNTFTDSKLSTTFQKANFLDSFYVAKETPE